MFVGINASVAASSSECGDPVSPPGCVGCCWSREKRAASPEKFSPSSMWFSVVGRVGAVVSVLGRRGGGWAGGVPCSWHVLPQKASPCELVQTCQE